MEKRTYTINDARPTGGKAGKGRNKTSTVQVYDDTDTDCAMLIKSFRFNVADPQSYESARAKASAFIDRLLTPHAADEATGCAHRAPRVIGVGLFICDDCGNTLRR